MTFDFSFKGEKITPASGEEVEIQCLGFVEEAREYAAKNPTDPASKMLTLLVGRVDDLENSITELLDQIDLAGSE